MGRIVGLTFDEPKKPRAHICDKCGAEFKTKKELDEHIKQEHAEK